MLKIKIAYIELDTHAEIAENFRKIMEHSEKISVDYYFSEKILNLLEISENENIFKVEPKNLLEKLKTQKYDWVIIGTAHRYFNIFQSVVEQFPMAIIGHNLNFIKETNGRIFKNIFKKETRFRLKLALKERLFLKNKIYDNAKILVLDRYLSSDKFIYFPLFFNEFLSEKKDDIFRVVIAGEVSQKRRDYRRAIEKIKSLKTEKKLEFIFLGKAKGEELEWLKSLKQKADSGQHTAKITYFTEKISQNIFDNYLKTADILWCPIQRETEFFSVKEIYGKTKVSGNISDAMRFGKNIFLPEFYPKSYPFMKNEIELDLILENPEKNKFENWQNFRKDKILLDLEKIILNFVENKANER